MLIVMSVNAALFHRERTGEGQMIETSLLQGVMSIHTHYFVDALECDEEGAFGIYPYRLFETSDDLVFIAAGTDKFWRMLCEELGVPEMGTDPRYDTNSKRAGRREEMTAALQPIFKKKTSAEWESLLVAKGVPCASVKNYQEFFVDPQVTAMEMNPIVEHPRIGRLRLIGVPVNFEKTPGSIRRAAPTLGQHTEEVLLELGFDHERIENFRLEKVIIGS
jgi:crotonobetainyl-CoA:carnitine CoA-transferase CaiB-like acyl-CoA transferase